MAKDKKSYVERKTRADGVEEYSIREAPQKTAWGRVIITILAVLLGLGTIASLIIAIVANGSYL